MSTELRQILWAWHTYLQTVSRGNGALCYSWVVKTFEGRFGCRFHQSQLARLVEQGFLETEDNARGGSRRYYTMVNPDQVADLLVEWGLAAPAAAH
jgi:hypothetical protein